MVANTIIMFMGCQGLGIHRGKPGQALLLRELRLGGEVDLAEEDASRIDLKSQKEYV